jgi:RNA polymerase-binding transcription factor DksA
MSGYLGNPDAESEHAMILSENGIQASREQLAGPVYEYCEDCDEQIPQARRMFAISAKMRCTRCVDCQELADKRPVPQIRMLTKML